MPRTVLVSLALALATAGSTWAQAPLVYRVALRGQLELEQNRIVERALQVADRDGAAAIVLELDLTGGQTQAAQLIVRNLSQTPVPIVAWVNRALGAGAMIALATDTIVMANGSSIGADPMGAEAIAELPEVARQAMQSELHGLVDRRGADPVLGDAMVDAAIEIAGLVKPGELLTLDADQAVERGLAVGRANSFDAVLSRIQLDDAEVVSVGAGHTGATVTVTNRNSRDIRVFFVRSTNRYRLGTVTSLNEQQFSLPEEFLVAGSTIQMRVEIIGSSESISTEQIRVEPGLVIEWVIETTLSRSNYFVWIR